MKKIVILTGACGYLGRSIAGCAAQAGIELRALALPGEDTSVLPQAARVFRGDVCDKSSLEPLFEGIGGARVCVIHAAGIVSLKKKDERVRAVNLDGALNMLKISLKNGARFVFVSTSDVLPRSGSMIAEPDDFAPELAEFEYTRAKAEASKAVLDAAKCGGDACVVLPTCIIGPGDVNGGPVFRMIKLYLRGLLPVSIKGGYDFIDVRDAAAAILASGFAGGRCYIISGRRASMSEVFEILAGITGKRKPAFTLPTWLVYTALPFASLWSAISKTPPLFTSEALKIIRDGAEIDGALARSELGLCARPLRESLADTVEYILNNIHRQSRRLD